MITQLSVRKLLEVLRKFDSDLFAVDSRNAILKITKEHSGFYPVDRVAISIGGETRYMDCITKQYWEVECNYNQLVTAISRACQTTPHDICNVSATCDALIFHEFDFKVECLNNRDGVVSEIEMLDMLNYADNVLLLHPVTSRKYLPVGLSRISSYLLDWGKTVTASSQYDYKRYDLVCISGVFTYRADAVFKAIEQIKAVHPDTPILLGGVFPTIMSKKILSIFPNVKIFCGVSRVLDEYPVNYTMDWGVHEDWNLSYVFTTRGCPMGCAYCSVKKAEPDAYIIDNWYDSICSARRDVTLMDNNIFTFPLEHYESVVNKILSLGKKGVEIKGFDCRHATKDFIKLTAKLPLIRNGIKTAFDRMEDDGMFQDTIRLTQKYVQGKEPIMAYILYNFTDTPKEAEYRARECIKLGIRAYPMPFIPLNRLQRSPTYVSKKWTSNLVQAFRFFYYFHQGERMTFEEYIKGRATKYKFTDEDIACWEKG